MSEPVQGEVVTDSWANVARSVDVPTGNGVRLTVARFIPRDGTWEYAFAGQWGTEWSTVEPHPDPEPGDESALALPALGEPGWDDSDGRCDMCGGPYSGPVQNALVYARPIALNRPSQQPALDARG